MTIPKYLKYFGQITTLFGDFIDQKQFLHFCGKSVQNKTTSRIRRYDMHEKLKLNFKNFDFLPSK